MDIRRATPDDADLLGPLWEQFTEETTYTPYPGMPFDRSLLTDHVALVAEEDGVTVGTLYMNISTPHFGFVFGVYTRPEARRRGVARELLRAAARELRAGGRSYVVLSVDTPNTGARTLYERLGFVDAARTLRAHVDDLVDG